MPLNVYRSYSKEFAKNIKNHIYHYDMVICDHYEVFQYLPDDYKGRIILHQHNAYYLMWERYAQTSEHNFAKRLVSFFESKRVKRYEKKACKYANLVFASPNDIDSLSQIGVDKEKFSYTYHLGDDSQLKMPSLQFNQTTKSLLYIGSLGWEANIDGLLWFFTKVWPKLKLQHPDLIFTIIGKKPDQRLLDAVKAYEDIRFTGFVDNLEPYFLKHRVFVAPLRFGAGMKVKVLNAMCRGIPTVTTSVGSEGMEVVNMKHIAIADNSNSMIKSIDLLLSNQKTWELLKINSKQLVAEKYTWKALFADMKIELEKSLSISS